MKNILVVDDMESELTLIKTYLIQAGYTVITAANGQEALNKVSEKNPMLLSLI